MKRRALAAAAIIGAALAMIPTAAYGDNFNPGAELDTSQVLDADGAAFDNMALAADEMSSRAVWVRWPDGAVTWVETP